jgi:predicted permease
MSLIGAIRARVRAMLFGRALDRDLGEEIQFHIDLETEKNVRLGMRPDEARRRALAMFGGAARTREDHRDVRPMHWLADAASDARFALRGIRRAPALAGAAIVTLALGIGANVAIFSAVNAVVLQPLPFPAQDRLMVITEENPEKKWHHQVAAPANMLDWRAGVSDFADVMGYVDGAGQATLTGFGDPQPLTSSWVTGNFFSTLGIKAAIGRTFTDAESWRSAVPVVILSDAAWRSRFGADPALVGKTITLGGTPTQVVGVMPSGFSYPAENIDIWLSVEWNPANRASEGFRRAHWLRAVARLKPGVTIDHARAQLGAVVDRLKRDYPATNKFMGAEMLPLHDFLVGDTRLPLLVLLTSVAFLLLIACANVGNLLLVQAATRERESALRLALGAGRARLVRQALVESLVLSAIGGCCGLALGWAGTRTLVRLQPAGLLRVHDFGVEPRVLLYVLGITVASGLLFGLAPALWLRRRDPATVLKDGGRGAGQGLRARRWGEWLVIGEVALAVLMTVGAGLLARSFWQVRRVDPGFDATGVLAVQLSVSRSSNEASVAAFAAQLESRVRALPGVSGAALVSNVPFTGTSYTSDFIAFGRPAGGYGTEVGHRTVSLDYFTLMKVPVIRGRTFTADDRLGAPPVIMINQALASSYFAGEDPIGQRIAFDKVPNKETTWYTIVGVVGNERVDALDVAPRIEVFASELQEPLHSPTLLARTSGNVAGLTSGIRAVVRELNPSLALLKVRTMESLRDDSMARIRFLTTLLVAFAAVGVTLAVVGVYGVLAHVARNRTREMGIRIALGAETSQVRWLVVRHGLRLTIVGLLIGGGAALWGTRLMTKLLFNVQPNDPATLTAVALLLATTSIIAAWLPARRASRADPASALRAE